MAAEEGILCEGEAYDGPKRRISARLSEKLKMAAKANTGIKTDTELLRFALAQIMTLPKPPTRRKKRARRRDSNY